MKVGGGKHSGDVSSHISITSVLDRSSYPPNVFFQNQCFLKKPLLCFF